MTKRTRLVVGACWAVAAASALVTYLYAIWTAPVFFHVPPTSGTPSPDASLTARHNARLLMVSVAGALVVAVGLLYTARNYRLAHRGQITDRFTKALERLGSTELYIRIGGVHALSHVMKDSEDHHGDIVEVLNAFIRHRAPRVRPENDASPHYPRQALSAEPEPDIQAALTVLTQRPHRPTAERNPINLRGLHLRHAALDGAQLRGASLAGAQLQGASLIGANLQWATLDGAQMQHADLAGARLQNASLCETNLIRADFTKARLQDAKLHAAQLQGAYLRWAQLQGASLLGAQLHGASLIGAHLQRASLIGARLQESYLFMARLQGAQLDNAHLQKAHLDRAQMQGASLVGARLQGASLVEANLRGASLHRAILCDLDGLSFAQVTDEQLLSASDLTDAQLPSRFRGVGANDSRASSD